MSRTIFLSSNQDDFVLTGAEGTPTVVPGVTDKSLAEDLDDMLRRLREPQASAAPMREVAKSTRRLMERHRRR